MENAPTVAARGERMVAVWYRSTFGDQVGWAYSLNGGVNWIGAGVLPRQDPNYEYILGRPSICSDDQGNFYTAALYGVDRPDKGITVAVFRGAFSQGSFVWGAPSYALPFMLTREFNEWSYDAPRLSCDPDRSHLYLTYTRTVSSTPYAVSKTVNIVRSLDGGQTWSAPLPVSSDASNGARAAIGPEGELYVVWQDYAAQQMIGRKSSDFAATFGPDFVVGGQSNVLTFLPGWTADLLRYNPVYPLAPYMNAGPDFPSVAVDRSKGPHRGAVYVVWADHPVGAVQPTSGFAYEGEPNAYYANATPVAIGDALEGTSISPDVPPYEFDVDRFTFVGTEGTTLWIEGEITSTYPITDRPLVENMLVSCGEDTLALSRIGAIGLEEPYWGSMPAAIYTLPATGRYYVEFSKAGFYSYSYRVRLRTMSLGAAEVVRDQRDVVLVRSTDGGNTWSAKQRVNDDPPRFFNVFPEVAADADGQVHVAWYDRREAPGCGITSDTWWSYSSDGGNSFAPSRRVNARASPAREWGVGEHLGLLAGDGRVHVVWAELGVEDTIDVHGASISDFPTGIGVSGFSAELAEGGVALSWGVADPSGIAGFRVHRAEAMSGGFEALREELTPADRARTYREEDSTARPGYSYRYMLEIVRPGEASEWLGPVSITLSLPAARLAWQPARPNPFTTTVRLELTVPTRCDASIRVYDIAGHAVATLHEGALPAGPQSIVWNGRDRGGREVAPGVYIVKARAGGKSIITRLIHMN